MTITIIEVFLNHMGLSITISNLVYMGQISVNNHTVIKHDLIWKTFDEALSVQNNF